MQRGKHARTATMEAKILSDGTDLSIRFQTDISDEPRENMTHDAYCVTVLIAALLLACIGCYQLIGTRKGKL